MERTRAAYHELCGFMGELRIPGDPMMLSDEEWTALLVAGRAIVRLQAQAGDEYAAEELSRIVARDGRRFTDAEAADIDAEMRASALP